MPAAKLKLSIEQGATYRHAFALKSGGANGAAMDLTGYTAKMQIRADVAAPDVLLELTTENGRILITPLEGRLELLISAADTGALDFDNAMYDLEITSSGGEVTRIMGGSVALSKQVTR